MSKNKKTVIVLLKVAALIAIIPFFALKGASLVGSYDSWFTPVLETAINGEIPGEIESLLFCVQTGLGVGIIFFFIGRFYERKKLGKACEEL